MKKRIINYKMMLVVMVTVAMLVVVVSGCSKKSNEKQLNIGEDASITVAKDIDKGIELPAEYPEEIVPIYKNAKILVASDQNGGIGVTAVSKDSFDKVAAFYKDVIKDANKLMENEDTSGFTSMGSFDGYTYTISIIEDKTEDYITSISIIMIEGETDDLLSGLGE